MIEISLEYWNELANHYIVISSLLGGFSIAIVANLLISDSKSKLVINLLKVSTVAAGSFLIAVFSMTKILMMTTVGYYKEVIANDFMIPRIIGSVSFIIGIIALSVVISLSGWTKSKNAGIFTTIVGIVMLLLILVLIVEIKI